MLFDDSELSVESCNPVELYLFKYDNISYMYTSSQYNQEAYIDGSTYVFNADYIKRGDSLKLGGNGDNQETCTITVSRSNPVALLYQGAPPEMGSISIDVYRKHGEDANDVIKIISGSIIQARFNGSDAELTISIEEMLSINIPSGVLSYFCQNCIYDSKCSLAMKDWGKVCYIDKGVSGLTIRSSNLKDVASGYFTDGFIKLGDSWRAISKHTDDIITIKYPILESDKQVGSFTAYPSCNQKFTLCNSRFKNTDNFSGVPYIEPYNAFTHPVDKGAYWIDGNIVYRDTNGKIT